MLEADSFWCMQKLLEGIQDNYTLAQPGIQTKIMALKDLMKRLDGTVLCCSKGGGGCPQNVHLWASLAFSYAVVRGREVAHALAQNVHLGP